MSAPTRRPVALLAALAAVAALVGCGVQSDSSARDLPEDEQELPPLLNTEGAVAQGAERIYLIGPGEDVLLRSVPREADSARELIEILLLGPNDDEIAAQYSTLIPPSTQLLSARTRGQFLIIDLTEEITELTPQSLAQAIAQIVYTATELEGIEAVQLEVNGEELAWPKPNGETTTEPLRIYDYPNFAQSAQPDYPAVPASPEA